MKASHIFPVFLFGIFLFPHFLSAQDKTYKEFDPNKIEIWKRVSAVNDFKNQSYSVEEADSLAQVLNKNVAFTRIFYTSGEIRKMEVKYASGLRKDFLWWEKKPLLIGVLSEGKKSYDLQYYFFEEKLYETKNPEKLPTETEESLKAQAEAIRNMGYEILKRSE